MANALIVPHIAIQPRCLMRAVLLQRVSVCLEDAPRAERAFAQALDWAFRLSLPLCAVVADRAREGLRSWSDACYQHGVALETLLVSGGADAGVNQFLRPRGLCVFVENSASSLQEDLLSRAGRSHENAVLVCAPACPPMTRILVLFDQANSDSAYLESVAHLCQALETQPIILVLARTERETQMRRAYVESVCQSFQLRADIDSVFGCDARSAVARVASWRGCSHFIVERRPGRSWWTGSRGNGLEPFRSVSDSLSLLALPGASVLDVPRKIRNDRLLSPA